MKKRLLEFLTFNRRRLLLLAMMLFIGQGAYSQGIKTVTTNANDGEGSLRQTIAEAVDGDVIIFDGALTTITIDSSLMLGDKTLTIDGGGDVVLERALVAVDSFRVVTINTDSAKVVTIKNLTIQNGLTLNEDGGGLWADNNTYGQTILEGIVFTNNIGSGKGGGAYITGGSDSLLSEVIDCEFIENKVSGADNGDGDGGGIFAQENTMISGCTFTDNVCDDDGGAAWIRYDVSIDNSVFTGNSAQDVGGAIRIQDRSGVVTNSIFESNVCAGNAGAVMLARGTMIGCEFYNNTAGGQGGAVLANQNECYFYDCVFEGNHSDGVAGALWMDDAGLMENCIVNNNTAVVNGGGVYLAGKNDPAKMIGCVVTNNVADSIGGGVFVQDGYIVNSTIANNHGGVNGGAIAGDGAWLLANSIVYGNDAAGDDKNIQVVNNTMAPAATNCAIDANGYDAAGWTASNITTLDASPFMGGSEADSLMLASGSALIDAGDTTGLPELYPGGWDHLLVLDTDLNGVKRIINGAIDLGVYEKYVTLVVTTDADDGVGSLRQAIADAVDGDNIITFADDITTIKVDSTLVLGDKTVMIDGGGDVVLDGAFNADMALDTLRVFHVMGDSAKTVTIKNLTIQNGYAMGGDGGGLYADHADGGQTMLHGVIFKDNMAVNGGGASIDGYNADTVSMVVDCEFTGNSVTDGAAEGDGGGIIVTNTTISGSTFTDNVANDDGGAVWTGEGVTVDNSFFTGNTAGDVGGAMRVQHVSGVVMNSTFESNTSSGNAGAIMFARGTLMNCEFYNNSASGQGGAVLGNNNEMYVSDCVFDGNSVDGIGGAFYMDDGGYMKNCIITNNTAGSRGGGVYFAGKKAPALAIGCLIANNTSGNGGGVFVQAGNVINCIITGNNAETNGGALSGEGEWFLANTVVWDNDAVGTAKNIEIISNTAAEHAAYSAIDATGYDAGAWTATNISVLDASPFVGGSEADSLYSASIKLIDAGTLDYGILEMLPETDLDGNARIQTALDLGAYEAEIISVLGIELDRSTLDVGVGATRTINATIEPDFATDKSVDWTSSDENVATVVGGEVTGVGEGTATITATTVDGGYTATCEVTVVNAVTGVTLNETAISLVVNDTYTLVATVEPTNATNPGVSWVSGNDDVATVTVDGGVVTAVAEGTVTISAVTLDGGFIASCEVTVTAEAVAVTSVSLDQTTLALEPAGTATLVATVAPEDATDKSVSWSSSDDGVATVADGVVTAVADGTCTITVTTTDGGLTATCEVTVESVGIEEHEAGFNLYPNPVSGGRLFIEVTDPAITAFEIYNVLGVVIHQENVYTQKTYELNTPDMQKSGIYFIRMIKDQTISVEQFIVE